VHKLVAARQRDLQVVHELEAAQQPELVHMETEHTLEAEHKTAAVHKIALAP